MSFIAYGDALREIHAKYAEGQREILVPREVFLGYDAGLMSIERERPARPPFPKWLAYKDARVFSNESETVTVTIFRFNCATCGHPIEIAQFPDGTQDIRPHYDCENPQFTCLVDKPRFLGIVSSL